MPNIIRLDLAICQVKSGVGMTRMLDLIYFVLDCQPSPKHLGMAVYQAQDSIGLAHLSDPSRLDVAANQVQDNYHPLIACLGK